MSHVIFTRGIRTTMRIKNSMVPSACFKALTTKLLHMKQVMLSVYRSVSRVSSFPKSTQNKTGFKSHQAHINTFSP